MSLIVAIDLSTKPGVAVFKDNKLMKAWTVFNDKTVEDFGKYPINYIEFAEYTIKRLITAVQDEGYHWPQFTNIVLEETTASKQNYSQKKLEFLHYELLSTFRGVHNKIVYIRDGTWKRLTNVKMSKEEKANNAKIKNLKRKTGKRVIRSDEEGNKLRKINKYDVYIRQCNTTFGTSFSRKDEDAAAASLLGKAFLMNAPVCDGRLKGGLLDKA